MKTGGRAAWVVVDILVGALIGAGCRVEVVVRLGIRFLGVGLSCLRA